MTKRVLIVFHTMERQTRKIADRVADSRQTSGIDVVVGYALVLVTDQYPPFSLD